MAWFHKAEYTTLRQAPPRDVVPDGLWFKCNECVNIIYRKD
ncbi:acetyl-CoA carboxylase carboxyl transferase subunit beta, partial [Candidatus Sumerlaeota bacterium]|nr:acetyl-CoA carboxylase carboxyl transferase subunit beta [Candidatus Sumerlaeota bacterium]